MSILEMDQSAIERWNAAVQFTEDGDFESAKDIYLKLAQEHYEGAALAIGGMLAEGEYSDEDRQKSIFWLRKAAIGENSIKAMFVLAYIFFKEGGRDNLDQGLFFLKWLCCS